MGALLNGVFCGVGAVRSAFRSEMGTLPDMPGHNHVEDTDALNTGLRPKSGWQMRVTVKGKDDVVRR